MVNLQTTKAMYCFTISTDTAIERGIVGRAELPELISFFKAVALCHSAKTFRMAGGLLVAERDDRFVTLSVTSTEQAIPSRSIFDSIEDAMANTFNNTVVSESLQNSRVKGQPRWPFFD